MFVFKIGSRRETNRKFTKPVFWSNLKLMFPEIEAIPHADTLYRLLENIEVEQIEETLIELFKKFIRKKKFKNYLYNNRYLFAIDGTQKHASGVQLIDEEIINRIVKRKNRLKLVIHKFNMVLSVDFKNSYYRGIIYGTINCI